MYARLFFLNFYETQHAFLSFIMKTKAEAQGCIVILQEQFTP
jgi:hypothetical protein